MSEPRQINPVYLGGEFDEDPFDFSPRPVRDEADPKDSSVPESASNSPGEPSQLPESSSPQSSSNPEDSVTTLPPSPLLNEVNPSSGNVENPEKNASAEKAPILPESPQEKREPEEQEKETPKKSGSVELPPQVS